MSLQLALVLFLFPALLKVRANYELEVRFESYSNTNNFDFRGDHCDGFRSSGCDLMFFICVRSYRYSPPISNADCTLGSRGTIGHPYTIDGFYQFPAGATFPGTSGLSNPVTFTGDSWPGSFQIMVRMDDDDLDANDLIDRVILNETLATSTSFSSVRSQLGYYGKATLQLSFRVTCSQNFYGSDCTILCVPQSSDTLGHFTCDSQGRRVCSPGYTGADCITPICSSLCQGSCTAPDICDVCSDGYTGEFCDQCVLATGCHADRAFCRSPGQCICLSGYSGSLCQIDNDVCAHQSPCRNGATCTSTGPDQYSCACPPGFTGQDCDMDIDYCLSSPCSNGATCTSLGLVEMFNCTCSVGWTGPLCTENIDECAEQSPCENGATCTDCVPSTQPSIISPSSTSLPYCPLGYNCTCPEGYFGERCETEIDYCDPSPCHNEGTCVDIIGGPGYSCNCPLGFTGQDCDVVVDLCGDNPCSNGATCNSMPGSYTCNCAPGYTGSVCDMEIDECASSPCAPNTTVECRDGINMFTCVCLPGYTGIDCSDMIDLCEQLGCYNEGTCTPLVNDFLCECPEGFNGTRCEVQITNCSPNPCLFGGTCTDEMDGYSCQCPPAYTGDQCEEQVDVCISKDCGQNMYCQQTVDLDVGYECLQCVAGQAGCGLIVAPANDTKAGSEQNAIIGGVVGGVVAALALLLCLLTIIFCLVKNNCCRASAKEEIVINSDDGNAHNNPMYFGASTLLSSKGSTLTNSYRRPFTQAPKGGKSLQEDGYISLDTVGTDSPTLPPQVTLSPPPPSMYNTFDQDHHYEHIPGQTMEEPEPSRPPALPADRRRNPNDQIRPEERQPIMQSGKYDMLDKEVKPVLQSGKYDKLEKTSQPLPHVPRHSEKFNPYVMDPISS